MVTRLRWSVRSSPPVMCPIRWLIRRFQAVLIVSCLAGASFAQAPVISSGLDRDWGVVPAAAACSCGQWTCPICQGDCGCGPGGYPVPALESLPNVIPPGGCLPPVVPAPGQAMQPGVPAPGQAMQPGVPPTLDATPGQAMPPQVAPPEGGASQEPAPVVPMTPDMSLDAPLAPSQVPEPQLAFSEQTGALARSTLAVPNMIGPAFGSGPTMSVLAHRADVSLFARGFLLHGSPGDLNSTLVYEVSDDNFPNDFYSVGPGRLTPDDLIVYDISEPVPPSDAPTSPGPEYVFDGGTARRPIPFDDGDLWAVDYSFTRTYTVLIPNPADTVVGRVKIAENTSPIPQDRIFFNYSLFDNVPLFPGGVTVNRFSPGFEKTALDGWASFEMRFPLASTLDSSYVVDGPLEAGSVEFGNLYMVGKYLLGRTDRAALSTGLVLTVPTASDLRISLSDGQPLVHVKNQSVHLMPFIGWLYTSGRFFTQGFVDIDLDTNGNELLVNPRGTGLVPAGSIQDSTLLDINLSCGYWALRRPAGLGGHAAGIRGFAPMLELHLSRSLQSTDFVTAGDFRIGQPRDAAQQVALVMGGALECGVRDLLTVGYTIPIGNGSDQQFDGELRAFWNRFF